MRELRNHMKKKAGVELSEVLEPLSSSRARARPCSVFLRLGRAVARTQRCAMQRCVHADFAGLCGMIAPPVLDVGCGDYRSPRARGIGVNAHSVCLAWGFRTVGTP